MDAKDKLLGSIEIFLADYAGWILRAKGSRSDAAEEFYRELLNLAFGYELKNMNREKGNYPGIDLGDATAGIAVQVTSTETPQKVRDTLKAFLDEKYGLFQRYSRLIILVAGVAKSKAGKYETNGFDFRPQRDIWDTAGLRAELQPLSQEKLEEVEAFLQRRLSRLPRKDPVLQLPTPERRSPGEFLGREEELAWIEAELHSGTKPVVIAGLGGIGKTALAVKFRRRWEGHVYFATFRDTFTRTLAESVGMAIPVQERQGLNEEQTAELALGYLSRCEAGDLLIIDNAEVTGAKWSDLTKDPFYEKLRRLPMNVLMTTRHRDAGGRWLGRLAQDDLREIFRRHKVRLSVEEMDALIDAVDGHTMTVDMIARTIRESWGDVTAEKILTAMANSTLNEADFDEIETDHDPEQRQIYAHLRALFDLSGISDDGKYALRCATLLPQTGMDEALFRHALTDGAAQAIKLLEKKGWVDRKEGKVTIHPVVRLVCRTELKPTDENCERFLNNCWNQYSENTSAQADTWSLAELFKQAVYSLEDKDHIWVNRALKIYWKLGELQLERGAYEIALESGMSFLELQRHAFPYDYARIADAYRYVGGTMMYLENYEEALAYQLEAISFWRKLRLPDNPALAKTYSNVGQTYFELGMYNEALTYMQEALNMSVKILPEKHPNFVTLYDNMGIIYKTLGKYEIALEYEMRLLEMGEEVLGRDNTDTARIYCQLAETLLSIGECEQAAEQMRRTAEIVDMLNLPEWHPIRGVYNNLMNDIEEKTKEIEFIGRRRANHKRINGWVRGLFGHKS